MDAKPKEPMAESPPNEETNATAENQSLADKSSKDDKERWPVSSEEFEKVFAAFPLCQNDMTNDYPEHITKNGGIEASYNRAFNCTILADGKPICLDDRLLPDARKDSNSLTMQLQFNSAAPGVEAHYHKNHVNVIISPDACERFDVDCVSQALETKRYDALLDKFCSCFWPPWYKDTDYPPMALLITCTLLPGRGPLFVRASRFKTFHDTEGTISDVQNLISEEIDHVNQQGAAFAVEPRSIVLASNCLRKARTIELFTIITDRRRQYMARYFKFLIDASRPSPDHAPRSFNVLRRHYDQGTDEGPWLELDPLIEHMVRSARNANPMLEAPPVEPRHLKREGILRPGAPAILDISSHGRLGAPIWQNFGQLIVGWLVATWREWQLQHATFQALREEWIPAQVSYDPELQYPHLTIVVRANGRLERHHFPPAGMRLKLNLRRQFSSLKDVVVGLGAEVAESDNENEDALVFQLGINRRDRSLWKMLAGAASKDQPGSGRCRTVELDAQLLLESSNSEFITHLEGLKWHFDISRKSQGTCESFRASQLFFRMVDNREAYSINSLLESFRTSHSSISRAERDIKEELAQWCQTNAMDENQKAFHRAFMGSMPEGVLFLQDPIGNDKTYVLAHCVVSACILNSGVICTAKSNSAVDKIELMVDKVLDSMRKSLPDKTSYLQPTAARVHTKYEEERIRMTCLYGGGQYARLNAKEKQSLSYQAYQKALSSLPDQSNEFRSYKDAINKVRNEHFPPGLPLTKWMNPVVKEYCDAAWKAEIAIANQCDCLIATSASLTRLLRTNDYHGAETVVFDEVSHLTVPDALAGLAWNPKMKRLVMAGDKDQIGPSPKSTEALMNEFGCFYSYSLFKNPLIAPLEGQCLWLSPPPTVNPVHKLMHNAKTRKSVSSKGKRRGKRKYRSRITSDWDGQMSKLDDFPECPEALFMKRLLYGVDDSETTNNDKTTGKVFGVEGGKMSDK